MAETSKRKCAKCKGEIKIHRDNICDVICYQSKYYHADCFEELATQRAASKRGNTEQWQEALDDLWGLEDSTKKALERFWAKDDLNVWLLDHYDVAAVPSYFWQVVNDLECGKYKQQRCKPVSVELLHKMWQWGQKRLDDISAKNKINHTGPKSDIDRLRYDLAILISHTEDYKRYVAKVQALEAERLQRRKETIKVDYNKIKPVQKANDGLDDISALLDEMV